MTFAGLDDQPPRPFGFLRHQAHAADRRTAPGDLRAHLHQRPHPPLVAGAACLDAPADPCLLALHQFVEPGILRRFNIEELLLAADVAPIIAGEGDQSAPIDLQDARRQAPQEGPIVGDEKHRLHEAQEKLLHPEDGVDVQVVRRLVQKQDVGIARQRPRQGDPPLEPGGERCAGGPFVEIHAGNHRPDPLLLFGQGGMARLSVGHAIVDGALQGGGNLLGQQGGFDARCTDHRTAVGRQIAVDQLQQGGLARAVAADQADALPAFDLHLHPVENRFTAEAEAHPL